MRKILNAVPAAIVALVVFQGTAFAAQVVEAPDAAALLDMARPVYEAILAGQYGVAAALCLVLAVGVLRRYAVPRVPFLRSDAGGTLLTYGASFGGALATHLLAAGLSIPTGAMLLAALKIGFFAAGGFMTAKRLAMPLFTYLAGKSPPWLAAIILLVPKLFDLVTGSKTATIAKAEKAGDAAVAAKPGVGLPTPRDVP